MQIVNYSILQYLYKLVKNGILIDEPSMLKIP